MNRTALVLALALAACDDSGGGLSDLSVDDASVADAAMPDLIAKSDDAAVFDLANPAAPDLVMPDLAMQIIYCGHPADCAAGQTCGPDGTCKTGACGAIPCIHGYTCSNGTCQPPSPASCDKDSDCAAGSLCIAGPTGGAVCTQPAELCFDATQCASGQHCVAGRCVLGCTSDTNCRDGYKCDTTLAVCTKIAKPCTITNDCGGPTEVCVRGACVPRSVNGACTNPGDVSTENGCVPNEAAAFTCQTDGVQDACATGSICLHHSCWISCNASNNVPCNQQPTLNTCKPISSGGTTYNVCGTASNLGGQCNPTDSVSCLMGKTCIDGFCR